MKKIKYLVSLTVLVGATSIASAAVAPDHLASRPELEVGDGIATPRVGRTLTASTPMLMRRSSIGQLATGTWTTLWDRDTGVATAIYGSGIAIPGSVASEAVAEAAARSLLADQLDILAPGASVSEFELVSNHLLNGIRTVGFFQKHQGARVVGGQIAFRFKKDRLVVVTSQALPNVSVAQVSMSASAVSRAARSWIDRDFVTTSKTSDVGERVIVPIVSSSGRITYHSAIPVTVKSSDPIGKWTVYIGKDRAPIARRQEYKFATGTVNYNVPVRWPGGNYGDFPAANATLSVDGATQTTNINGVATFNGATGQIITSITGPLVRVVTETGSTASDSFTVNDGGSISWNQSASETNDAQLATFIHSNIAKEYARVLNPNLAWLDQRMTANVNINDSCNAFATGDSINMFRSSAQCGNTGQLADVVYHEFGHNLHINSIVSGAGGFDGALSEGIGDYLAGTMTDSPVMGIGFFNNTSALRHLDNRDFIWPDDIAESHTTGRIFATTMWDIRKMLIAKMGQTAGVAHADKLFYAAVQRAADIPSSAVEILLADDDDGNLANGTPNQCDLEEVLAAHGLAADIGGAAPGLELPVRDRFQVAVPVAAAAGSCNPPALTAVNLAWKVRGETTDREVIAMTLEGNQYVGEIPVQNEGLVIQYRVDASYDDGGMRSLPKNAADPYYEFYNGATSVIYCSDFESGAPADWSLAGGNNTWEWGPPTGSAGNPPDAYSGANIFGTNLSGRYSPDANITATTPIIDVSGHDEVRLQYRRWLGVEENSFDRALISSNGAILWENAPNFAHEDREWRFQDVDLTAQAQTGTLEVSFGLATDPGLEFAGWNIDDVCVVSATASVCGDELATGNEGCDDGTSNSDSEADACRSDCQPAHCGDGVTDTGEQCDDGNDDDTDDCSNQCLGDGGGCGCQSSDGGGSGAALLFLLLAFGYIRRNRKRVTR